MKATDLILLLVGLVYTYNVPPPSKFPKVKVPTNVLKNAFADLSKAVGTESTAAVKKFELT